MPQAKRSLPAKRDRSTAMLAPTLGGEAGLNAYLAEFTFRFNRRRSSARGLLFHRLAEQAVAVGPVPYGAIIGKPANQGVSSRRGQ